MGMTNAQEVRLVVSGSREYSDHLGLRAALGRILDLIPADWSLLVKHGGHENPDYSTMADRIAQEWAIEMEGDGLPVRQEPWPADWEGPCRESCDPGHRVMRRGVSLCPAAGPYRNEAMCADRTDWGLAALQVGTKSTGTRDCLLAMIRHGIRFELVVEGSARGLPRDLISSALSASDAADLLRARANAARLPAGLRGPRVRGDR